MKFECIEGALTVQTSNLIERKEVDQGWVSRCCI
jgi:hypothetical protein